MAKSFSNQENFYKRLRELSNVDAPSKSARLDQQSLIEYSRANDGSALGIIKEDSSFYIKASNSKGDLGAEHFTYIGGLENKLRYKYETLAEAKKNIGFYVGSLNEALEKKFNVALLKEEKEFLGQVNADKGVVATAQDKADKNSKGETIKPTAKEVEIADPLSMDGIAKAQAEGDKKKADDASQKLKQGHEASATSSGAARGDIAKAQVNADATPKASIPTTATEKQIAVPAAKTGGPAKAQSTADVNKANSAFPSATPKEIEPASDAKKEKAIVVENFGEEETEVDIEEPSASAAGAEMGISTGGDEHADLDAAASTLDDLNIKVDAEAGSDAGAPDLGGSASAIPSPADAGMGSGAPEDLAGGMPSSVEAPAGDDATLNAEPSADADADLEGGDNGAVHDVEKLVGKTGQKIRSTELTDEMVGGFLKSLLSSFDGKIENLDSNLRRELANKILKAGEEGEESNGSPESVAPTSTEPNTEKSPSAEPGAENLRTGEESEESEPEDKEIEEAINQHLAAMGKPEEGGVDSAASAEHPNSFKKYVGERGYDLSENISIMEMASLVTGYANECDGNTENADMETIAEYMSEEVVKEVSECGYGNFAEGVKVFNIKPKAYKSATPIVEVIEEEEEVVAEKKEFSFAPEGQSINKAEKEKEEEKKEDKKEEVSESAKSKLKAIINTKIQEQLGLKKPSINEAYKSSFSKKLDDMIADEIEKGRIAVKAKRATNTNKVF